MRLLSISRFLAAGLALAAAATPAAGAYIQVPGVGNEGQGADTVILQLDSNALPDMILMAYDAPSGANSFRYRVGFNLNASGVAASWTSNYIQVPGVGNEGQGAGAAAADLNGNGRPDLIFMAYDNPSGANSFRYKIGWDLNASGVAASWSNYIQVPGVGNEGQGAAAVIGQIDSDPRPDMILMAYDAPSGANSFRYRVGFNLNASGVAASWSSNYIQVSGVGNEGQGAGAALVNLDGNAGLDIVFMAYDAPSGANSFRYRIGYNLSSSGVATWAAGYQTVAGVGNEGQGAGLAIACLASPSQASWFFMAYDAPSGANNFRYTVAPNGQPACPGPPTANVRKSITQLSAAELASLRKGVAQMMAWSSEPTSSANFKRSWKYWANMHSFFNDMQCEPQDGLNAQGMTGLSVQTETTPDQNTTWCTCEHGTIQFLTWHRMYLYYFEQVLQAAAGDPTLRLPFWDYETNGQIPQAYRDQTYVNSNGQTVANPLFIAQRQSSLNAGTASLDPAVVSTSNAMSKTTYSPFNGAIEGTPHGAVHCATAVQSCPTGYMGAVPAAGNDPIFYAHHTNIDRLYECWLQVNPATRLPTDPGQLNTTFSFIDGTGTLVSRLVKDMLTTAQLGYTYAAGGGCPAVSMMALAVAAPPTPPAAVQAFQISGATRLNRGVTRVPLRIAPDLRRSLAGGGAGRSQLVIEELDFDRIPPVLYKVYLQPAGGGERVLVGVINFFNRTTRHGGHGDSSKDVTLDATQALSAMAGTENLEMVIEPTTGLAGSTVADASARLGTENVRFRAVRVDVGR
jgi:hypothetical protein